MLASLQGGNALFGMIWDGSVDMDGINFCILE